MPKIVDHAQRREHISEIVANMMADVGVEKTTIREISRQSGYSRGFIEHYFPSKDELIAAALKWVNEQTLIRVGERLDGLKGLDALRALNEETLPITEQARKEWKIRMQFWGLAAVNPDHQKDQSKRIDAVEKIYLNHLREAQDMGTINKDADLLPIAHSLLHRIYGLSCNAILRPTYFTKQRQIKALDHIFEEIVKAN